MGKKSKKKKARKSKGKTGSKGKPESKSALWKAVVTKGLTSIGISIILILIALLLHHIPCSRSFSIETTSKQIITEIRFDKSQKPVTINADPFLTSLTAINDNIELTTAKFRISATNQPELKDIRGRNTLKARSKSPTYYEIQNTENIAIPLIIYSQPENPVTEMTLAFREKKTENQNALIIKNPFAKTTIDLSAGQTTMQLRNSEINYGEVTAKTNPNGTKITGKPNKILIEMEGSKNEAVNLYTQKGKPYALKVDNITPDIITKITFNEAGPDTTIYIHNKVPLRIKDKYPAKPTIIITGTISDISRLDITDQGIAATMNGSYVTIEIAGQKKKNTALEEAKDFGGEIWRYIRPK